MKILDYIEEIVTVICMIVMTVLTFANVIARYVFSASFSFSEEITTYLFVLASLLGSAIAAKRKAHLGLTILTDNLSAGAAKVCNVIGYAFGVLFSGGIFYYGILMVISQYNLGQKTAGMQWPEWIFGSFVLIGALFVLIRFIQLTVNAVKEEPKKEVKA